MAFTENSPVEFCVFFLGGEKKSITANSSVALFEALEQNGLVPKSNDHFVYYHHHNLINPCISIGGLHIRNNDTIVVLEQKKNKKEIVKTPKNPIVQSQSFDNFRAISAMDYPVNFTHQSRDDSDGVYDQPQRPLTATIIPPQPRDIPRDPLPKFFVSSQKANNDFWNSLERRFNVV